MTDSQLEAIKRNPNVDFVENDRRFEFGAYSSSNAYSSKTTSLMSQTTPWGITRVGGPLDGAGKKAWIIDTGIDLDHPDLNVDVTNSASFVASESADDIVGHGTHVAGILAAKNNSIDAVGVAANASVVAVKVLHQNPLNNTYSDVVDGVNYVAGKASSNDIINMSLGAYDPNNLNQSVDVAVTNAANSGLRFTIAAGNDGEDADDFTPARVEHSNVWTMSGYDVNDDWYTNSNYGNPPIEYSGPGVNVPSLDIGGGITNKTGTSMAAPHIAGLLLVAPNDLGTDGTVNNDPDTSPDDIAIYDPFTVSISGPSFLESGELGTWTANPINGSGSYSYQWYFKNIGSSTWQTGGTSSSYSKYFNNSGSTAAVAGIRVIVTSSGEQAISTKNVTIGGEDCPSGQICL